MKKITIFNKFISTAKLLNQFCDIINPKSEYKKQMNPLFPTVHKNILF
jgi:hypothetical protein